jgi:hypothetical protein
MCYRALVGGLRDDFRNPISWDTDVLWAKAQLIPDGFCEEHREGALEDEAHRTGNLGGG